MASASGTYGFLNAAVTGNLQLLKRLVNEVDAGEGNLAKTVASFKDKNGTTAFHFAATEGKTHVCKFLIEYVKLDINIKDGKGETPLHHAILGEYHPTTVYLIEKGANPNAATDHGFTPLHYAAEKGLKKLVHLLISKGAEVDAKADSGTPLQRAAGQGKKEAVKILLDNHANPNLIFHHIFSPLVVSILAQSFECVKLLLQAGANPNISSCGVTSLGTAASEGETQIIKCLLNAGADPNVTDNYGSTPIEIAALQGNHENFMILFPWTSPIPSMPEWSFAGIMKYVRSEEARQQRKRKAREIFLMSKSKGKNAFNSKDYIHAIYWYTEGINSDPFDATVLSNRSLCWARLNEGDRALSDAQACLMLRPDWPKAYYREGVAWKLLKDFERAADSFYDGLKLDPENKELQDALCEAIKAQRDSRNVPQQM